LAGYGILFRQKLGVAIIKGFVCFFVEDDESFDNSEAFSLDHFEQIKVIKFGWQISNVKGG